MNTKKPRPQGRGLLAPPIGFEPITPRLTVECSAVELWGIVSATGAGSGYREPTLVDPAPAGQIGSSRDTGQQLRRYPGWLPQPAPAGHVDTPPAPPDPRTAPNTRPGLPRDSSAAPWT